MVPKSDQTWQDAECLLSQGRIDAAANRYYYSVFQMVKQYGLKTGKMTDDRNHSVHLEALNIVGPDRRTKSASFRERMNELYSLRIQADYTPVPVEEQDLKDLLTTASQIREHHRAKLSQI